MFVLEPAVWKQLVSILCLMVILVSAAIGDCKNQEVPNWVSMTGWIVAPAIAWVFSGLGGLADSLLGMVLMLAILVPLWVVHWFGAADVKLIGTVGAFVGVSDALVVLLGIFLTGLLMVLIVILNKRRSTIITVLKMKSWRGCDGDGSLFVNDAFDKNIVIPYALPIALGTILSVLYLHLH